MKRQPLKRAYPIIPLWVGFVGALSFAPPALSYVGPGAGLTMLGALWAVIVAIVFMLAGLVLWPLRALRRRKLKETAADGESQELSSEQIDSRDGPENTGVHEHEDKSHTEPH